MSLKDIVLSAAKGIVLGTVASIINKSSHDIVVKAVETIDPGGKTSAILHSQYCKSLVSLAASEALKHSMPSKVVGDVADVMRGVALTGVVVRAIEDGSQLVKDKLLK